MYESASIGVVGDKDSVLGFLSLGFKVVATDNANDAGEGIKALAEEGAAVIFVTEDIAEACEEIISKYAKLPTPAIVMIPGASGGRGLGMASLRKAAESAVGADILFN
jgi:V/A-type H+-transporting ATPase subunit F